MQANERLRRLERARRASLRAVSRSRARPHRAALLVMACVAFMLACNRRDDAEPALRKLEVLPAPPGVDVAAHVAESVALARRDGKQLVVYVGAAWCEPCRYFHDAAASGALDEAFGDLRLVEFDLDRDGRALEAAGYKSELVPLFAIPRDDGRASGKAIEGSIKGAGAVDQIAPRLRALLAQ